MTTPAPAMGISGPHAAPDVCASTIVAALSLPPSNDPLIRSIVGRDRDSALVGAVRHQEGGMFVLRRNAGAWCRIAGGAMSEADLAGIDGVGRYEARRLFARLNAAKEQDAR